MHPVDLAVHALAAEQCGVFARRQAVQAGASGTFVARRLAGGRWTNEALGVYGMAGTPKSFRRSAWIAWLAGPPSAVFTHWTGGALRRLEGFPPNRLTLTVPHGCARGNPVAQVFQTSAMPAAEGLGGLPVASVERILLGIAAYCGPRKLTWLIDAARTNGHTNEVRLRRELLRLARSGRDGITNLRLVLDQYAEGPVPERAELERHLDAILRRIPAPVLHEAPLPGREWSSERVDRRFDWPRKLIVEGDSRRWHTRVADFRRDRERDRAALRAGYPTVRYAFEELVDDAGGVEAEILDLLGISEGFAHGIRS